ncbi:MAG TPA: type IV secretion system DNA-binding domain-containing protein [Solirubrobacteraceae bacterium]|nr:type IV secretion system DNA-binding domain-containing protein [Solirubrobacteraceae bacterium]
MAVFNEWRLRIRMHTLGPRCWYQADRLVLGRAAYGRLVTIPFGGRHGGTHTLLVGATGSGKTVTQTWIAARGIERGMGAVVVDPKGDRAMRAVLARMAARCGREFIEWTPTGPRAYNPFARGSDSEVADKVLAGERFTEPHYLRQAQRFLGHAVRALRANHIQTSLQAIARTLDPEQLELLARDMPESAARGTYEYLDSLTPRQLGDIAGVRDRLAILAESDVAPWLENREGEGACFDLLEAARDRAVVYFDLDADRRPLLTQMLGAAIVQDLQTTVASLQSQPIPTVVVIDEFSALATEQVVRLFGRARSAAFSLVLGTQELSDLRLPGRPALAEQVLGNLAVVVAHRQVVPASAELICSLAGSRGAWRTSHLDHRISRTRIRENVLQVEEVMNLAPGCAAAVVFAEGGGTEIVRVFAEPREVHQ